MFTVTSFYMRQYIRLYSVARRHKSAGDYTVHDGLHISVGFVCVGGVHDRAGDALQQITVIGIIGGKGIGAVT